MANVTSSELTESRIGDVIFGVLEFTVGEASLTTAGATQALTINKFPANAIPLRAVIAIGEYFTGGTVSAMTAQIGDTGDPNGYVTALNVFDTTTLSTWTGTAGVEAEWGSTGPALTAAFAPEILFTATGDDVADCDAGFLTGRIHYRRWAD